MMAGLCMSCNKNMQVCVDVLDRRVCGPCAEYAYKMTMDGYKNDFKYKMPILDRPVEKFDNAVDVVAFGRIGGFTERYERAMDLVHCYGFDVYGEWKRPGVYEKD
jgi:hypothetical protein